MDIPNSNQHYKVHSSFLLLYICNFLCWQWQIWNPYQQYIYLFLSTSLDVTISLLCHYHPHPVLTSLGSGSLSWAALPGCCPHPAWLWCSPGDNPPAHISIPTFQLGMQLPCWAILCRDPLHTCWTPIPHPYGTWICHVMLPHHGDACLDAGTQNEPPWSPCPSTCTFLTWPYLMAWALNCLGREEVGL